MKNLHRGAHVLINGKLHAVLIASSDDDIVYTIDVKTRDALPQKHSHQILLEHATAAPTEGDDRQLAIQTASKFASDARKALRDRAWDRIKPLVDDPLIFDAGPRWSLIERRAESLRCAPTTLLRDLRRYWQNGQSADALLGRYDRCGTTERCGGTPRGRRTTKPGHKKFAQGPNDLKNYKDVIETFYLKEGTFVTIPDAVLELHERHYSYLDGNGKFFVRPEGEKPSQRQFEYYLRKHYSLEVRIRSRRGDKEFERNHRAVLGAVEQMCRGVGHIYELDASIVDIHLVSELNRADLVGRPVVYLIIDRGSRLFVGWYLGLENASWPAALQAIFSLVDDKEAVCRRLGLRFDAEDWPAHGILPQEFFMDRGEGIGREPTKLCSGTTTTVTNLPSLRPDWKPLVEGAIGWMHRSINSTDGYQPASIDGRRRTKDNGLDATLTLQEFESILVQNLISYNRTVRKAHNMTRDQIAAHVEPSPINLWNHGIRSRAGQLARFSSDALRLMLLPTATASVDEHGIFVNGCFYRPKTVNRDSWFVEGRRRTTEVDVSFDMRRADKIYVHDRKEPGGYFIAKLTTRSEKAGGLSVDEAAHMHHIELILKGPARQSVTQNTVEAKRHSRGVQTSARQKTNAAMQGRRRSSRRDNLVEARDDAKNLERDRTAVPTSAPPAAPAPAPVPTAPAALADNNVISLRPAETPASAQSQQASPMHPLTPADRARRIRQQMMEGL